MTSSEWVWVFSDDDVAQDDCVESFLRELESGKRFDLYRFQKETVDDDGRVVSRHKELPTTETAEDMVLARFVERRSITVPEHIFSRSIFDRRDGFVDFPVAWFSDDATWANFARTTGIKTVAGGKVMWRTGAFNLSKNNHQVRAKVRAFSMYTRWLKDNFPDPQFQLRLISALRHWAPNALSWWAESVPILSLLSFWKSFRYLSGCGEWRLLASFVICNSRVGSYKRRLAVRLRNGLMISRR